MSTLIQMNTRNYGNYTDALEPPTVASEGRWLLPTGILVTA